MIGLDTNVLPYAYDTSSPDKQSRAVSLPVDTEPAVILRQVARELPAVSVRKRLPGTPAELARKRPRFVLDRHPPVLVDPSDLTAARELLDKHQLQFRDARIYAGRLRAGMATLYSQDLPAAPISGLDVRNAFPAA